ncbi:MAG: acylneuraminate cytidylyltransferase family protein [Flavobacterium sp.]|uniref:acylneuraminate cytidylyltransferase family protein n=1 Tax=Flavobacterium sp. TaxID=239 RepID=UPI00122A5DE2|nr:acylneuraminate cytidylyltransferase family protein [Flavobacterium sp.]RZJ66082.1 MAG: acylneuraminate cytidylyltransferase family protein [Flavobacterium sp.]
MKTIAVIPARGGSKRLPGKNLMLLGDKPLIAHSILYARLFADIIDEVFVTTDDDAIAQTALRFGAKVIKRPAEISGDNEPTVTSIQHVLEQLSPIGIQNVVLLQPTNPLRPEHLLRDCFSAYQKSNADSLFTVSRDHHKLGKIQDGTFKPFNYEPGQRSQDLEPLFFENGLLYISNSECIRNGNVFSSDAIPFPVDHVFSGVDIDTRDDLDYAQYLYQKIKE